MFTSSGKVVYDPQRSMKSNTTWWCVLEISNKNQIGDYYRHQLNMNWWDGDSHSLKRDYHRPPHKSHISIIRGEKPRRNIEDWGKFMANKKLDFKYDNNVRQTSLERDGSDHFWFLKTWFDEYNEIRCHFGLNIQTPDGIPFTGHITIARSF